MNLYILRHAPAVERGNPGYEDDRRPLTPEGERRMRKSAAGMKTLGLSFDLILASPLTRAMQTAEIVAAAYDARDRLRTLPALASTANPRETIREIEKNFSSLENLLLVGHEPHLGRLISLLTTGGPRLSLNLKKGAMCKLRTERLSNGRCATLRWLITPKQLTSGRGKQPKP
jgi:phosphohistidine phosphatase